MFRHIPFAAILLLIFAFETDASADTNEPSSGDEIVVTGARTGISLQRIGSAATIIDREEIERRQARYVTDLLRSVPGFAVSHTGVVGAQTQVRVRGAEANHVLVLIDGIRANDPATGDEFRWEHLTTGNIQRVEIVRGPQSALWGSDAVAAVVNVITTDGSAASRAELYVEGGSNESRNAGVNGSLRRGDWQISAALERLATDGENISRTGAEDDGAYVTTGSLRFDLRPGRAWRLSAGVRVVDALSEFDPVDFFATGLPADGDVSTESRNVIADVDYRFDGERVDHRIGVRRFESRHDDFVGDSIGSSTASDRAGVYYQADIELGGNSLSLAAEHERTDFRQRGAVVFGDPNQDQRMATSSLIVDFAGLSHDRLGWFASARLDSNSDFDDSLTGRLAVSLAVDDATSLRASIGRAQKNPTFIERFGFFPAQFVGNPDLEPERSTTFEIGIERRLANDRLTLQLTHFHENLDDEIDGFVFDPVTFLATAENRSDDSRRRGVEVAGTWQPTEALQFSASYTYVDSSASDMNGNDVRELRRPLHSGSLGFGWRPAGGRWSVQLNADYGGTRLDRFFPPFPQHPEIVVLDSHWLVDLNVELALTDRVRLFARGRNLLDSDHEQVFGYRTAGIAGLVGVRLRFGQ